MAEGCVARYVDKLRDPIDLAPLRTTEDGRLEGPRSGALYELHSSNEMSGQEVDGRPVTGFSHFAWRQER